jgi:WD40-like Beta Propeller Repeat
MRNVGAAVALLLSTLAMAPATSAAEPDDRIAYARLLKGGGAEIFVANPDGSDEQLVPLEHLAEDFTVPIWSPDHEWLLISHMMRFDGSGEFLPWRPAIVRPDGSDHRRLEVPDGPQDMDCTAWSTDGSRIFCALGGERLTDPPFPPNGADTPADVSPDGSRLVFSMFVERGYRPLHDFARRQRPPADHRRRRRRALRPLGIAGYALTRSRGQRS